MPHNQPTILVLWGSGCDELVACTFVTVLRRAGLRVKLVGVSGRRNKGAYGLTLAPDLSLREALPLASHAAAVVIPCQGEVLRWLMDDAQLVAFFEATDTGQTQLVVQEGVDRALLPVLHSQCVLFPADDRLPDMVEEFASGFQYP